jgi:hypothetical protein
LVLSAAGLGLSLFTGRPTYQTSATLAVVPATTTASGTSAYQLDVVSRGIIVPTLATVLEETVTTAEMERLAGRTNTGARVRVSPSDQGGALLIRVTAAERDDTALLGRTAVELAGREVADLAMGYQLSGGPGGAEIVPPRRRWLAIPAMLGIVLSGFGLFRWRRRRKGILKVLGAVS